MIDQIAIDGFNTLLFASRLSPQQMKREVVHLIDSINLFGKSRKRIIANLIMGMLDT